MNSRNRWIASLALASIALFFFGQVALRAHRNLVTLDVRKMDVREVVGKIRRQTWETIFVSQDVSGRVTLNVKDAPLDKVLDLVASQVSARSRHLYPIFKTRKSLKELHRLAQSPGSNAWQNTTWTNFARASRVGGGRGGGGPGGGFFEAFDATNAGGNALISMNVVNRDPVSVARQLGFASRLQVIPADTLKGPMSLYLHNATRDEAVAKFARETHAKSDNFYVLQGSRPDGARPGRGGEFSREPNRTNSFMADRLATMTPEQRARMEEMRNLTPEDRQARMQQRMEDPAVQQRMAERTLTGIRNSTPEQIVQQKRDRMRRMDQMQRSGQPGGGRPRPGA